MSASSNDPLAADIGPEGIIVLSEATYVVRYTAVAFCMLMVYDYFITLDNEVNRVWPLRWRLPKILFLMSRYVAPPLLMVLGVVPTIPHLSEAFCTNSWDHTDIETWPTVIAIGTAELILIPRVAALYGNSKLIFWFLMVLIAVEFAAVVAIVVGIRAIELNPLHTLTFLPGCFTIGSRNTYAFWIPPVIFESAVVALTLFKWSDLAIHTGRGSPILRLLVRDSLIYFLFMFTFLFLNLLIDGFSPWYLRSLMLVYTPLSRTPLHSRGSPNAHPSPSSAVACVAVVAHSPSLRKLHN